MYATVGISKFRLGRDHGAAGKARAVRVGVERLHYIICAGGHEGGAHVRAHTSCRTAAAPSDVMRRYRHRI